MHPAELKFQADFYTGLPQPHRYKQPGIPYFPL